MSKPRNSSSPPSAPEPTRPGQGEFGEVAPYYDALMLGVPYTMWVDYVERLIALAGARVRRVLDLACGTGQVGAELAARGYEVVGADLSFPMARQCLQRRPPLPVAVMDATRLGLRAESLDLVVCLYDSLNYVLDPAGLQECFARVAEALRPGGLFIFDLNTTRALSANLFTQQDLHPLRPLHYRWRAHWDPATRLCRVDMWFRWRGAGAPREFEETHYERAYEPEEVRRWLQAAGFAPVRSFGAYTLLPILPRSDRMYFLAQRPA